jgi:hypothetical protein
MMAPNVKWRTGLGGWCSFIKDSGRGDGVGGGKGMGAETAGG